MSRARAYGILGLAAAVLLSYVSWEWFLSPEARVKRALLSAASAAERSDVPRLLSHFTDDYSDFLHPDRAGLEASLRDGLERVDRLNVTLRAIEVELPSEHDRATVRLDLVVVAIRGEERYVVLGTPLEAEKLEARLRREGGAWKIERVEPRASP